MGLFELSTQVRNFFRIIGLLLLGVVVLWLVWVGLKALYTTLFPSEKESVVAFGVISGPYIPKSDVDLTTAIFNLELPENTLPKNPTELPVYPIPKLTKTPSSLDEASSKVSSVGFNDKPKKLSEITYQWVDLKNKNKSLKMNIALGEFIYKYNVANDPTIVKGAFKVDDDEVINKARNFLQLLQSYHQDLEGVQPKLNYYKQTGNKRNKVASLSKANAVEVLFSRQSIEDKYPIVSQNPNTSLIRVVLGANVGFENGVVEAEHLYWEFDLDNSSLYPIKNSDQAWNEFQQGKASFVSGAKESFEKISLTDIYLAYFEPRSYQSFAQPTYVFTGSGESKSGSSKFVAYLPAVENKYIKGAVQGEGN